MPVGPRTGRSRLLPRTRLQLRPGSPSLGRMRARQRRPSPTGRRPGYRPLRFQQGREAFEEPFSVGFALFGQGPQEGGLDSRSPDATLDELTDPLVEERTHERARPLGDRADHTVEVRGIPYAHRTDGVYGFRAVLTHGEDVDRRPF